ncbi:MAG: hypothetical protein WD691_01170 [Acidimicrobiales bacterium]
MAAHMAPTDSPGRRRALLIALGVGLVAVAIVETTRDSPDRSADGSATSVPTVLGTTVTNPLAPRAKAATPATFDLPGSTTASTRARAFTSTTGPAEVIDPVTIENTTTTTTTAPDPAPTTTESPTTTDASTTTAEP